MALRREPSVAFSVAAGFAVLTTIDFDHQTTLMADKISDIRANGRMAPKAHSV
jgi:hypothetical protein